MASTTLIGISGASGLFGSAFLRKLPENIVVTKVLSLREVSTLEICDFVEELSTLRTETFLHLAWPASSSKNNYRISRDNFEVLRKTIILAEACLINSIKFVGIGSAVDYISKFENYYQMSKFVCREVLRPQIEEKLITWIRPHYVFDNKSWPQFLFPENLLPVIIQDDSPREYIHLDDVISALYVIIQHQLMGQIDIGSGFLTRPSELCRALGKKFEIHGDSKTIYDNSAKTDMNSLLLNLWSPRITRELLQERK